MNPAPYPGEVWRRIHAGRLLGIYVVVAPPRVYAPEGKPQIAQSAMLDLEKGKVERFNVRSVTLVQGWFRVTHVRHLNKLCTWHGS